MRGRATARRARVERDRTVALIGAYFAGMLAQADWKKVPDLADFLARFEPREPLTNDEIAARFAALVIATNSPAGDAEDPCDERRDDPA